MTPKMFIFAVFLLSFDFLHFTEGQQSGTVRLVRNGLTSTSYTSGRVQIYMSNDWGYICDNWFASHEADVICHQLGYSGALNYSRSAEDSYGVDKSYYFQLYEVYCYTSNYLVILQCSHSSSGTYYARSCERYKDEISVVCLSTRIWDSPYPNQIRLSEGEYTSQGLVEVYCNGQWGTVCDHSFYQTEADTVCTQLGYTGAAAYDNLTPRGSYSQPIWLDNVDCHSRHSCLRSCQSCPSNEHKDCSHSEDITVECEFQNNMYLSSTTMNSTCDYPEQLDGRAVVGFVLGIMFPLSVLISISACIGVAWSINRSRRNRHPVAYHVVDNADTTDSTTSSSFSTPAATNLTSSSQPVNQPLYISGTPASQQHNIPRYIPTRAPVLTANNETTTQPLPNTAPLVSSFSQAQTVVGDTPTDVDSQPTTSSDIV